MNALLAAGPLPDSVRVVNLAGEPLSTDLVDKIYEQGTVRKVYDLYGPSESTTYSTFALRDPKGFATIGRPIANTEAYIMDARLQPVPVGVPGEIFIGGAGLARGYLNRPELTAERFIPNPFSDDGGDRLYRTGDRGRYRSDGNIEFLGRSDNQVKIRGCRIELGEIETTLNQHPEVKESVVVARDRDPLSENNLVAYFLPRHDLIPSTRELRSHLKAKLPDYMLPSIFVPKDVLPSWSRARRWKN
jgi:non-ribosomal peptide synthetase component F